MNFRKSRTRSNKSSVNVFKMSEKWQKYKRLKRSSSSTFDNENSSEDDVDLLDDQYWDEFFSKKHLSVCQSDEDMEVQLTRKQTLILSTLVPDEILTMERLDSSEPSKFVGVLMMADVSGFTSLSERYNNTGKGGTCRLTVTLNTYLGSLIDLIYSHGGDVIKFAGDAFLALWKTDKRNFLCHTIHNVIACALTIQQTYGSYETDVKVNLKVKLAISAGNLIFAPIGTGIDKSYVIFGLPVIEAKHAESMCESGEVKLSATAWGHCYSRNYDHVVNKDGSITIKSILYDPREKDVTKPFLGISALVRQVKKPFAAIENLPDSFWDHKEKLNTSHSLKNNDPLSLRKTVLLAEERNIGSEIRRFIIRPVITQIDAHQPLEYLTEIRNVSILFITLKPKNYPFMQVLTIVNNTYQIVYEIVYKSMGCVNKIILFDKDVMILVIFGLRGFKHESVAQAALKCSYSIKKSVAALDGVEEVSIGLTTGPVYCGVVGHPLRREYTVIGAVVNKAARLMCKFRNKITCDETTFIKSKMSTNSFTLQPSVELRGIGTPGKIFEYTEDIGVREMYNIQMIPPLLDRRDEKDYYKNWLNYRISGNRDFDALLLVGESLIGKSRILKWMARHAKKLKLSACFINLTSIHSASPFLALSQIWNQIFALKVPITGFAKEEKIIELLKEYNDQLCYLNDPLKVRFAYHEGVYTFSNEKRTEKAKTMFTKLITGLVKTYVIFLDDLQNLDQNSWDFIFLMFSCSKIFFVFTVTQGKFSSIQGWLYKVFTNSAIRKMVLGPLNAKWIAPLACQILDVNGVPTDLCQALVTKCKGLPGLIENFIIHLYSSGALHLHKILENEISEWSDENLQFPNLKLLHPQALDIENQSTLDLNIKENYTGEISICVITEKEELNTNINQQNSDAIIMIQIDSLTPYQQLLLKIASVIGSNISRDLLENIMYNNNILTTAKAVKRLFAMRIFACANAVSKLESRKSFGFVVSAPINCDCNFEYDPEENGNLPKYAYCKIMKFRSKSSRQTCYELLPINQKKEFHSRIVNYFQNQKQKCPDCGGNIVIVDMPVDVEDDKKQNDYEYDSESNINLKTSRANLSIENETIAKRFSDSTGIKAKLSKSTEKFLHYSMESNRLRVNSAVNKPDENNTTTNIKRVTISSFRPVQLESEEQEENAPMITKDLRAILEASNTDDWHTLGIVDSEDKLESEKNTVHVNINIQKGVSLTDFLKCTCAEVNTNIFKQLIFHSKCAEMKIETILFLIKYSYFSIINHDCENAIPKLVEAENECYNRLNQEFLDPFQKKLFLGKIHSLRSLSCFMTGKHYASKLEIERALRIYHINLRQNHFSFLENIFKKCKLKKYRNNDRLLRSDSIFCLNVATLLYSALKEGKLSRVSAIKAFDLVQEVKCNISDICDAFTNALQIEIELGTLENTDNIEKVAINTLNKWSEPIQSHELYPLGKVFMAIYRSRLAKGDLVGAIRCGYRALAISRFLHADTISLEIIPTLFYLLIARSRILEAVEIIKEIKYLKGNHISADGLIWYYALCMDMILDCGFQVESPIHISYFAEGFKGKHGTYNGPALRRLIVNLWIFWLRTDVGRQAKKFENDAINWKQGDDEDGEFASILSALRLAEGMLESLAKKIDDLRKLVDLMELHSLADSELIRIESDASLCRTIYPRWMLLKAYSLSLSGLHDPAGNQLFKRIIDESGRIHNRLEEQCARAALGKSNVWIQSARNNRLTSWQNGAKLCHDNWHILMYRINMS